MNPPDKLPAAPPSGETIYCPNCKLPHYNMEDTEFCKLMFTPKAAAPPVEEGVNPQARVEQKVKPIYTVDESPERTINIQDERGQIVAQIYRFPRKDRKNALERAKEICDQLNERGYVDL